MNQGGCAEQSVHPLFYFLGLLFFFRNVCYNKTRIKWEVFCLMRHSAGLPMWYRLLFSQVMLSESDDDANCTVDDESLPYQVEDLTRSVDTSHQREKKQQYEYDQVVEKLPKTQEELDTVLPEAEAAQATVTDLKAQRKTLREEKKTLEAAIEAAKAEETEALQQAEDLRKEIEALQQQVDALQAQLN